MADKVPSPGGEFSSCHERRNSGAAAKRDQGRPSGQSAFVVLVSKRFDQTKTGSVTPHSDAGVAYAVEHRRLHGRIVNHVLKNDAIAGS